MKLNSNIETDHFYKRYKIYIYPTDKQKEYLDRSFELTRYVWNWALEQEENQYKLYLDGKIPKKDKFIKYFSLVQKYKKEKEDKVFLNSIQYESARIILRHIITAYEKYFYGSFKHPKFKSKKYSSDYYPLRSERVYFEDNMLRIPGLPNGDKIYTKYHTNESKSDNIKYYDCYICKDSLGRYYIRYAKKEKKYINYFSENNIPKSEAIGIDLNVEQTIVCSNGNVYKKPDLSKINKRIKKCRKAINKDNKLLSQRQKKLERTNSAIELLPSKNANKRTDKLRKLYIKKTNIIKNFIYQSISRIIKMNPKAIVMEDLDVIKMKSTKYINKYISDCNFGLIYEKMEEKCRQYNIPFITADRFYPSSQLCSNCGATKHTSQREYHCNNCGLIIDRDLNAAKNLATLAENYDYDFSNLMIG